MRATSILSQLGRAATQGDVQAMLDAHGLRWRPALDPQTPERFTDWFALPEQGIEFGFMDEAYLRAEEPGLRGRLPMLFHEVIFYNRPPCHRPYSQALPHGLDFAFGRAQVQALLHGNGWPSRAYRRDVWDLPDLRLIVSYGAGEDTIADVICCLREGPWPSLDTSVPPHPSMATVASLLGQQVDSPAFRQAFLPLGVGYEVERLGPELMIDLRQEFGFDIHVGAPPAQLGRAAGFHGVFDSITFYRDRDLDARAWAGELPFGLSFDDSPAQAFGKLPGRPDEQRETGLGGSAVWRLRSCWLQVVYSTLDNLVWRVSLFRKELLPIP
jgi:hypothetical protein